MYPIEIHLAQCDIFVAPSRYESFGLVFLEAMMFGKPVVGCRAGGMTEVVEENVTGLLAEPGDPASLEAALDVLLRDPAMREAMGRAARERYLAHFTREKLTDRTLQFYIEILAASPSKQLNRDADRHSKARTPCAPEVRGAGLNGAEVRPLTTQNQECTEVLRR